MWLAPVFRVRAVAALLAAVLLLAPSRPAAAPQALRPLGGVDQLKAWFNANRTHPRVLLLLSPT